MSVLRPGIEVVGANRVRFDFNRLNQEVSAQVRQAVRISAREIRDHARKQAPRRSGRLRRSIRFKIRDRGLSATVGTRYYVGRFYEYGTAPHRIKPKSKKALAFGGQVRGSVQHPGQAGKPFFFPTWEQERGPTVARIAAALVDATRRVGR